MIMKTMRRTIPRKMKNIQGYCGVVLLGCKFPTLPVHGSTLRLPSGFTVVQVDCGPQNCVILVVIPTVPRRLLTSLLFTTQIQSVVSPSDETRQPGQMFVKFTFAVEDFASTLTLSMIQILAGQVSRTPFVALRTVVARLHNG